MPDREAATGSKAFVPEEEDGGLASIPRAAHLPGAILLVLMWIAYLVHLPGGMIDWAVSGAALSQGRYATLVLHMFAHGGLMHIGFNSVVLFNLAGPLVTWMGHFPGSWLRFYGVYFACGLGGAATYLALHPGGPVPMLGASGAIFGLLGLALRLPAGEGGLIPIFSREMIGRLRSFLKANLWLFVLLSIPFFLGASGGIAWEAHLGGFVVGLLVARLVLVGADG